MPTPSASLPRRDALALAAVVVLGWAVAPTGGMYSATAVVGVLMALALAVAACSLSERNWPVATDFGPRALGLALVVLAALGGFTAVRGRDPLPLALAMAAAWLLLRLRGGALRLPASPMDAALTAAVVFFGGLSLLTAEVLCGAVWQERTRLLTLGGGVGFVAAIAWLFDRGRGPARPGWGRVALVFAAGGLLRVGGLLGSQPIVDVEVALREAPRHLLDGRNPYAADYPDPYQSNRARDFGLMTPAQSATYPFYPPHPFLAALPFRAAGLDVRWANVVADLLAAAALLAAGAGRDPRRAALLTSLYLLAPRAPFLIEHGWYEPMLAAALGGGLVLAERGGRVGYLALGLGLTAKQFGLPLLFPLARAHARSWRRLAMGIAVGAALAVPFLLWGPDAFLEAVLFSHLRRPVMYDSLTLSSAAMHLFGAAPPKALMLAGAAGLVAWLTYRTPPTPGPASALWAGTALLAFCVLHTQGYFNYFYLVNYLLLLGLAGRGGEEDKNLAWAPSCERETVR